MADQGILRGQIMDYIENVLLATGGHAAPVENLSEEIPEGYHRMPDGTIMKDSEHEDEAALEKNSDDPCWSGYVQVGMKTKNGKRVPNCVPSSASIDEIVAAANSNFGESRHVSNETAYAVARNACDKYSYLSDDELESAILWDLHNFIEYATTGTISEDDVDSLEFAQFLPEGHPSIESSLVASLAWVAGASELDEPVRNVVFNAFSEEADDITTLHAATRLKAIIASGAISEDTQEHLNSITSGHFKVD